MLSFALRVQAQLTVRPQSPPDRAGCRLDSKGFFARGCCTVPDRLRPGRLPRGSRTTPVAVWDTVSTDVASILGGALLPYSILDQHVAGLVVNEVAAAIAGGTVGVMGTLTALEVVKQQGKERKQCPYCRGTGQLPCGRCFTAGRIPSALEICGDVACEHCVQRGFTPCNHCEGTGRLIPIEYERALQAQFEDYDYASAYHEDYYIDSGPPFM